MENERRKNPRLLSLLSLKAMENAGKYANLEVSATLERGGLSEPDRGLYTALVYGVLERRLTLEYILQQLSKRSVKDLEPSVRLAACLGLYQLIYMDRIPEHAAVSESVSLVSGPGRGFVNAVLRSFLRGGKTWKEPDRNTDLLGFLSVRYSTPRALVSFFIEQYGEEETEALLRAFLEGDGHVCFRVHTLRTDTASLISKMKEAGVDATLSPWDPDMIRMPLARAAITRFDREGFVEDEASRLAARLLNAQPGETVVDTCAAPGGKTFSLALDMRDRGTLWSFDLHANKLSLIAEGADKLGLTIVRTEARDARQPKEELIGKADAVLCDAPCSGLGVIGKKPDVKYKDLKAVENLPVIQRAVLEGSAAYVRPGGRLVYSTCTLNRRENEEVVRAFLEDHPDFSFGPLPEMPPTVQREEGMLTFRPHCTGTDGFFAALLQRKESV